MAIVTCGRLLCRRLRTRSRILFVRPLTTTTFDDNLFGTGICVYNSLTKSVMPFTLNRANTVHWYMCGPTVYDDAHMGHASCYVKFDILRRIMENFFGLEVVVVLGITDVDDKIIQRSSKLKECPKQLSEKYERRFFADMRTLNVTPPSMSLRVTEHISEIITFVGNLIEMGFAYVTDDGSVYFDLIKYGANRYGRLTPQRIVESHSPPAVGQLKRNGADFALWKSVTADELDDPGWPSPWCKNGRPGWHVECSAMSSAAFGETFDVHSGGVDLQFPHHENELAQSCARHNVERWVNYWWHSGHVLVEGEKMSKSLGNAISVRGFLDRHEPDVLRVACLMSHYRKSMNYTESMFEEPRNILKRLRSFVGHAEAYIGGKLSNGGGDLSEPLILQRLEVCKRDVRQSFANDFDTHRALESFMDFVTFVTRQLLSSQEDDHQQKMSTRRTVTRAPATVARILHYVQKMSNNLGIVLKENQQPTLEQLDLSDWENVVDEMVKFRHKVRETVLLCKENQTDTIRDLKRKLLEASDRARNVLTTNGFEIQDHRKDALWIRTKLK